MTLRKMIRSSGILRSFRSYDVTKRRQTYADHLAHTSTGRQHGITDEDKQPEKTAKTKKKAKSVETLTSSGYKLFERLKKLRLEIAREESMPPYIIFSDKTLIDMAAKMPASKPEMLDVSGVGENKFAKYGERFLEVIEEYRRE